MHTKGPWAITYDPKNGSALEIVSADPDHRVAFIASDGRLNDARLMASSPKLLAALEALLAAIGGEHSTDIWCRDAQEAIAEARGDKS